MVLVVRVMLRTCSSPMVGRAELDDVTFSVLLFLHFLPHCFSPSSKRCETGRKASVMTMTGLLIPSPLHTLSSQKQGKNLKGV